METRGFGVMEGAFQRYRDRVRQRQNRKKYLVQLKESKANGCGIKGENGAIQHVMIDK